MTNMQRLRHALSELPTTVARWADVPCIVWWGGTTGGHGNDDGYAAIWLNGQNRQASRVAFEMFFHEPLLFNACHHCDNRRCVNPHHIFDAGQRENIEDAYRKGRILRGSQSAAARHAKVDPKAVFSLHKLGLGPTAIAGRLGISQPYASRILRGERRNHAA